jgi:restriction endonuclease S subunit
MEVRPGYKQTEVGIFPDDWEEQHLSSLVTTGPKNGYSGRSSKGAHGTPTLSLGATTSGSLVLNDKTVKRLEETIDPNSDLFLQSGDVLVQRSNTLDLVGTTAVFDGPSGVYVYPDLMMRMRFREDATAHWFWRYANSASGRRFFMAVAAGSSGSMPKISGDKLRRMPVPVPALPEQSAIATALSDVDSLLGGLDRLIAKKRDLKQAAMQQLLTGETRLPGFERGWEERPLATEVLALDAGVSVTSIDVGGSVHAAGPAILKTSAVDNGAFLPHECKLISPKDAGRARLSPRADSILISRMNTIQLVGECGYVDADYPELFVPDRLWMTRFRPDSAASAKWLSYVFSGTNYREMLRSIATGTSGSMKNISQSVLLALPIAFPPPDEQCAIAAVLSDMDAELAALEARRHKTRALKQAMMQELLTGKTRLVPHDATRTEVTA